MDKSKKNKHLTSDCRSEIQSCLDHGMTFKDIGKRIGKDQTTVSKEVKKHITYRSENFVRKDLDGNIIAPKQCPSLVKPPFVCNPCKKRHANCGYPKQLYIAGQAQKEYVSTLTEAREGIPLNKEEFYQIDSIIKNGIDKGQHIYHILQTHNLGVSKSTVYRHLKQGYLSVAPIDFPRVVKFKQRTPKKVIKYVPKGVRITRTFDNFQEHIAKNNINNWVEMDTVIGRIGGKVIITFDFTVCNFMFGLLTNDKSVGEVTEKILELKQKFVQENCSFSDIFPVILTDNGGEFSNASAIENNEYAEPTTKLFFCDPYKSSQKPYVEKNHTLFRDIVPKGKSFDLFSQETVNRIFSHVNSVKRKVLNGKTPYETFSYIYGEKITKILGIDSIPANQVIQSPKLLKK
jgi:IS30 family transposase